jgi:hypothetical protein
MLSRKEVTGWLMLVLVVLCPLTVWGTDREIPEPKISMARLEVQPGHIDWLPDGDYKSLVLTIAGPGDLYFQREFAAGETPSFGSADVQDGRFPDGNYAYELRGIPRQLPSGPTPVRAKQPSSTMISS